MATKIDQKAYLQKYLGGPSKDKKKKKKKVVKGKGIKIIDDDLDLSKLRPLEGDELDVFDEGEDAPQIAGIIDERPEELKKIEQFQTGSKWRVINQDDGFNSQIQVQEIKRDIKEQEKENEIIFGKMYSDSEDEAQKNDSDLSPPRNKDKRDDSDVSPPRKRERSPVRKRKEASPQRKHSAKDKNDSDISPPRQQQHDSREKKRRKPSRWEQEETSNKNDSDISPPRKSNSETHQQRNYKQQSSPDQSPPRKTSRSSPKRSNKSPERSKKRYDSDSDVSPPRKEKRNTAKDNKRKQSPQYRNKDLSPRRDRDRHIQEKEKTNRHKSKRDSSSDLSPPRSKKDKRYNDSDASPPRKQRDRRQDKDRRGSDSDLSPPRRKETARSDINDAERVKRYRRTSDSPPPSNKKMARTLEGKKAGLQDARQLREENDEFRKKEEEVFKRLADDVSGRNAKAVSRRSKRETSEERKKQKEKAERQKELDEKYKKWSKGLKQIEAHEERMQDFIHEASKPLARHKDDRDLEDRLKQIERDGDPMLQYINERKRERGELPPEKPTYKGNFPPNRFNIRPGYRWDGVDRSNGYEKKYFDQQSKRKALAEEAYKWSTEDL